MNLAGFVRVIANDIVKMRKIIEFQSSFPCPATANPCRRDISRNSNG